MDMVVIRQWGMPRDQRSRSFVGLTAKAYNQTGAHSSCGDLRTGRNMFRDKVNIRDKLASFSEYWQPKIVGRLNGQCVKLVKFRGEFIWHHHENEDELFLVISGRFRMDLPQRQQWVEKGEFIIVPRGVEHRPFAEEEVEVLLFEPESTLNTGNHRNEFTAELLDHL